MNKFPVWYERIGGAELFSNLVPSTFVSFEESNDILWFIIMDDNDEIGTIWFERKDPAVGGALGSDVGTICTSSY